MTRQEGCFAVVTSDPKTSDPYNSAPEPIKIGLMADVPGSVNNWKFEAAEFVANEHAQREGRPIEFVPYVYRGAPSSPTRNAVKAYERAVEDGCIIVIGPTHSDNGRVMLDRADQLQVPVIQTGASEGLVSEYNFLVPWGTTAHDSYLLANWCRANGHERITVTLDEAWHVQEYIRHFRAACEQYGIRILAEGKLTEYSGARQEREAQELAAAHRELRPDATVGMASGSACEAWIKAVHRAEWNVAKAFNADLARVSQPRASCSMVSEADHQSEDLWIAREGWVGSSIYDEENPIATAALSGFRSRFSREPICIDGFLYHYTAISAAVRAVQSAKLVSPAGIKDALEDLKCFPSAIGGKSTEVSFGKFNRVGVKGKDHYVMRKIVGDTTELVHRFDSSL